MEGGYRTSRLGYPKETATFCLMTGMPDVSVSQQHIIDISNTFDDAPDDTYPDASQCLLMGTAWLPHPDGY
jgi:hypothetical protein